MVRFRDLAFVHSIRHPMQDDDVPSLLFTANPQPWCTSARKKMAIKMERFSMVLILALALALAGMGHVSGASYKWHVTVGQRAQDCYSRPVLLINGQFQPTLELTAGEELELTLYNDLPADYQDVEPGLTIHWHGFNMGNGKQWYDGASYITQCPVMSGQSFTYRFKVTEFPGTYFWHAHTGAQRIDGLSGPLIVRPRRQLLSPRPRYEKEYVMFIQDWYHTPGGVSSRGLNQPFDTAFVTNTSGQFTWVGNPQSVLINGQGNYKYCNIPTSGTNTTCSITKVNASSPDGCSLDTFEVVSGRTYLFRIINAASLTYQTICFDQHNVTIVAADARPVTPYTTSCVDVNAGQRYDVLLTANRAPVDYWISSNVQFRPGSPSGYAVLHYRYNIPQVPQASLPQPGSVAPWNLSTHSKAVTSVMSNASVPAPTVRVMINISQPLLNQTGQIRWALNNVASLISPPCSALQQLLTTNGTDFLQGSVVTPNQYNELTPFNSTGLGLQQGDGSPVQIFVTDPKSPQPMPVKPVAGTHLVPLSMGDIVEVIIQNNPANSFNGDYRPAGVNRTAMEQHPMHMHGHHFWVLGYGNGSYTSSESKNELNMVNPPMRDTVTVFPGSYTVFRFVADNPGTWLLHCHIFYHQYMGQLLAFYYGLNQLPPPPSTLPTCPASCIYTAAPWANATNP